MCRIIFTCLLSMTSWPFRPFFLFIWDISKPHTHTRTHTHIHKHKHMTMPHSGKHASNFVKMKPSLTSTLCHTHLDTSLSNTHKHTHTLSLTHYTQTLTHLLQLRCGKKILNVKKWDLWSENMWGNVLFYMKLKMH